MTTGIKKHDGQKNGKVKRLTPTWRGHKLDSNSNE